MLDARSRCVKKETRESDKRWRNRFARIKDGYNPRKVSCEDPEVEKQKLKWFEFALYQSRENKTKWFTEDLCSTYEFVLSDLDSLLPFTISYIM